LSRSTSVSAFVAIAIASLATAVTPRAQQRSSSPAPPQVRFRNVAAAAGVAFVQRRSSTPGKYFVESTPGGVAVFDYNGDGRPDIFFTNSADVPSLEKTSAEFANRLYRNDGSMKFTDVTDAAGVAGVGYSMGAAAADYDNDGRVDLFVAGATRNQLLHNRGDGTFEDVTARAGIASGEWAAAAGWFDYDNDGLLDLWIVNYVQYSSTGEPACRQRGVAVFCNPHYFKPLPNRLYRNRGDGTFEDVTAKAGLLTQLGKGMSVAFADVDRDGRVDVFVTNDTMPNFLFHNNGDGTFTDTALLAGVSVPNSGQPVSGMGVDAADYDNDGWDDVVHTALAGETYPLFHNDGRGGFVEATQSSGLARLTTKLSGWCSVIADFDNDGWKDIFTANSHVYDRIGEFEAVAFKQPNALFLNDGRGNFRDVTASSGFGGVAAAHRGCGVADLNADGRLDVVVLVAGGPAEVWQNDSLPGRRWLIVRLVGTRSNRDGIGARVTIGKQTRMMTTSIGYASSSHAGLHFGLGTALEVDRIVVDWPSGAHQTVDHVKTNQAIEIKEN